MTPTLAPPADERVLLLAPTGRDAALAANALGDAGVSWMICASIEELCESIAESSGAAMITEEALDTPAMQCLREELERQPPWADLPLIIFVSRPSAELAVRSFEALGPRANVTLIERPIRVKTMVSAAHAALRARRRQYEVRDLLHELEQRVQERDNFLAMLSHELRNPLAAISLAADMDERDVIVRQTRHLKKLVDDLLDIGRVTSGKISLHRMPVDFADVVEHCVSTVRPRIEARRLRVEVTHAIEHAWVNGDPVRLEQVVNNVLSNAVKYTPPEGWIHVIIERDDGEVVLRVRDSGKGIPPEMLTRIFDLFMQGDVSLDRSEGGMGIGLTLVRKLTELHGGSVRAYSRGAGSGSEFVIRLPLAAPPPAEVPSHRPAGAAASTPRHIVVVEDNADIRDLLRIKLRHLGHRVDTAEDGVKGLETVLSAKPDIALVDIGLPGLDGYDLARRVRKELGNDVYLVALTGYGQADDRKRALEAGFDVHLTKPADLVDLQNVLAGATR
jgi:signal transduction histidine kinase/CheY-like chemotaxis protein